MELWLQNPNKLSTKTVAIGKTVPSLKPPQISHTVKLGRMITWKIPTPPPHPPPPPPLATLPNPVLSCLSGHSDPIVLKPFDDILWYSGVPRMPNLLKISSDIESDFRNGFFRHIAHRFESWMEFLWPLLAKLHENAFDATAGSSDAWRLPIELAGGGILCSGVWKHVLPMDGSDWRCHAAHVTSLWQATQWKTPLHRATSLVLNA